MKYGIAHVALYTSRFDDTIAFYEKLFDARKTGYPHTAARSCLLQIGNDVLELFESPELGDGLFKHIAITCDDVDATYEKALACGAVSHVPPKDLVLSEFDEAGTEKERGARIAFVRGLAGEQIELLGA